MSRHCLLSTYSIFKIVGFTFGALRWWLSVFNDVLVGEFNGVFVGEAGDDLW